MSKRTPKLVGMSLGPDTGEMSAAEQACTPTAVEAMNSTHTGDVSAGLPAWLERANGLGGGERLIRLTSGSLKGELVIVCDSDSGDVRELVYTEEDWRHECGPSLGFDEDGDLCWLLPDGSVSSRTVSFEEVQS
jgi:hypothetical protein